MCASFQVHKEETKKLLTAWPTARHGEESNFYSNIYFRLNILRPRGADEVASSDESNKSRETYRKSHQKSARVAREPAKMSNKSFNMRTIRCFYDFFVSHPNRFHGFYSRSRSINFRRVESLMTGKSREMIREMCASSLDLSCSWACAKLLLSPHLTLIVRA